MTEPHSSTGQGTSPATFYGRIQARHLYLLIQAQLLGTPTPSSGPGGEAAKRPELPFVPLSGSHPFIGDKSRYVIALESYTGDFRDGMEVTGTTECHVPRVPGEGQFIAQRRELRVRLRLRDFRLNTPTDTIQAIIMVEWPHD